MRPTILALSFLTLAGSALAQETYSAKSLFFGEDDRVVAASTESPKVAAAPASAEKKEAAPEKTVARLAAKKSSAPRHVGASYFIRLKKSDGSVQDVLASRRFRTGERFQLAVKVNRPSYIYVFNEAPDGKVAKIYPVQGQSNFINAMGTVFLPGQGSFEFDAQPGTEQLLVYLSPTPLTDKLPDDIRRLQPDMVSAPAAGNAAGGVCPSMQALPAAPAAPASQAIQVASASPEYAFGPEYASKGIAFRDEPAAAPCNDATAPSAQYASKGIVFNDDPEPANGGQVASYIVKTSASANPNLLLKIKLVHE